MKWLKIVVLPIVVLCIGSCEYSRYVDPDEPVGPGPLVTPQKPATSDDVKVAVKLVNELTWAAPMTNPADEKARDLASKRMKESVLLETIMNDSITWGGRGYDTSYDPKDHELTKFNSVVFRGLYLSLYMFSGEYSTRTRDNYLVLTMPCFFRNQLDSGAYPYPFWHKPGKWGGYQTAAAVEFVIEKGKLVAAYRSSEKNNDIFTLNHHFDGKWEWADKSGKAQPFAALYSYLLSDNNPHAKELDGAYRAFALEARKHSCMNCHNPENNDNMEKLTLLNYPNQTLTSRHEIVAELLTNSMPPKSKHAPKGIQSAEERKALLQLAQTFSDIGDKALEFEKEKILAKKETSALPVPASQP